MGTRLHLTAAVLAAHWHLLTGLAASGQEAIAGGTVLGAIGAVYIIAGGFRRRPR